MLSPGVTACTSVLVDAANFDELEPEIIDKIAASGLIGIDIETHDTNRHPGLEAFNKDGVFDTRRTTVCGFSIYCDGDDVAYYVNLGHSDIENRVPWEKARRLLDAKNPKASWIAHNAAFELVMMKNSLGYDLGSPICTMQMCVSAYNGDEYDVSVLMAHGLGEITTLLPKAAREFHGFQPGSDMNARQAELFSQVTGKASRAAHSWNGLVSEIAYGYGLKQAVRSWFGYKMQTFEETLGGRAHMGELTGQQAGVPYGAEDAYWCVKLFHRLLTFMAATNPAVIDTFFQQELPMVNVYADVWRDGLKINSGAVERQRAAERANCAAVLRRLKKAINERLPFPSEPHRQMLEREPWYAKNWESYRNRIAAWAAKPDSKDDFTQCYQASGAVSTAWAKDHDKPQSAGPNFTHYMMMRTVMYDLLEQKCIVDKGKVQSDDEARGTLIDRMGGNEIVQCINELAGIEQRMKLYLTPYTQLIDPETDRMYPVLSSRLNSRRMATSFPNPMQLAKRGASTYVRGFYEADSDDEVIISLDWSQIELVLIGEFSGDPEFKKAYGQLPYDDLHTGAAVDGLSVLIPEMNLKLFKELSFMDRYGVEIVNPKILIKPNGEVMDPGSAKKFWRTEIGKGSNFNYWYSGALSTVGQKLGWTSDQMWEATDRYRQRFAVAEQWRKDLIDEVAANGFITLPDGHRRVRFEATQRFASLMQDWFGVYENEGITRFGQEIIRNLVTRSKNQAVNSMIQGSCATLAKRSIIGIRKEIKQLGMRARFMLPIHDELVWSVHRSEVLDFLPVAKRVMTTHPEIIKNLKVDCTASVGNNFEPWNPKKAPFGQIELDEAPDFLGLPAGQKLDTDGIRTVLDYLKTEKVHA
jgi:DNA polymerase I-like protein with 3'-5' exonuclease and polymerase domains